jgi:hypothetical protein
MRRKEKHKVPISGQIRRGQFFLEDVAPPNSFSVALEYYSSPTYCILERNLHMVESRCFASCCGDVLAVLRGVKLGGKMIFLLISCVRSSRVFLVGLSWMCSNINRYGLLKIILICPTSSLCTRSLDIPKPVPQ